MENFEFYVPTKVVFGKGAQSRVAELVKEFGGKKVLVHFGGGSVRKSGLLKEIEDSLVNGGIDFVELGGVVPNPLLSKVREGISLCKKENIDFILAVGGGSVIDSSKAIAYGLANDCDVWDLYCGKCAARGAASVGAVLTIAAAGSETSESSVITNDDGMLKRGYSSDFGHCKFAIMNPELTYTLPKFQTFSGCVDIVMHTLERYFSKQKDTMLQDSIAEALIRTVIANAKILQLEPENYAARAEIMWASTLSHNGVTGYRFIGDWASHQLEHELSGMFGVAHGAGLSAIWGAWARYVVDAAPEKFARLGRNVFGIDDTDDFSAALKTISSFENIFSSWDMPTSLGELGIKPTDEQLDELARKCSFDNSRTIGAIKKLGIEDIRKIYAAAR